MIPCIENSELLGAWLDGELSAERSEAVRLHVAACSDCAEEYNRLKQLDIALASVLRTESGAVEGQRFWRDLESRIASKRPWYSELTKWMGPVFRSPSFAWAVPACIVLLLGAVYLNSSLNLWSGGGNTFTAVESVNAFGRNVALLREDETKTTVIWLYQSPQSESETNGEIDEKGPAF